MLPLVFFLRIKNPEKFVFTWKRSMAMARLDYFLMPVSIVGFCESIEILPGFKSDHSVLQLVEFKFVEHNGNKLSEEEKQNMDRKATFEEVTVALKNLKVNKTPGCNGLMPSIYQILWDHIGRIVFDAIVYAQEIGKLHLSARRGIISLIPKIYLKIGDP